MFWALLLGVTLFSYEGSVARVRTVNGDAMVLPYGAEDWEYLTRNDVLSEGDMVKTLYDSRMIFSFGRGNMGSLDENTRLEIVRLDDDFLFRLQTGRMRVMTRQAEGMVLLMDTEIYVREYSTVRFQKDGAMAKLSVIRGEAEIENEVVRAGEMARVYSDGKVVIRREFHHDGFDSWASRYERKYIIIRESGYLPDDIYIGTYDLDAYGHWRYVSGYGWVWIPDVGPDWRPYYYGHWTFRVRIGWVWVSYEDWGWVPYHYGRWAWVSGVGWIWVPDDTWRGAWVVWYEGPSWISWAPVDPYGRPIYYVNLRGKRRWVAPVVDYSSFKKQVYRYKPPHNGIYKKPVYKTVNVNIKVKDMKRYEKPVLPVAPPHIKPVYRKEWAKKAEIISHGPNPLKRPVFVKKNKSVRHISDKDNKRVNVVPVKNERKRLVGSTEKEKIDYRPSRKGRKAYLDKETRTSDTEVREGRGREVKNYKRPLKKTKRSREKYYRNKKKRANKIKVDSMEKKVNNKLPIER